jgi:amino acid transporter
LGMLFLVALTVSIRDMNRVSHSASPVAEIMKEQFGPGLERPFLLVIGLAFFGAAVVTMAGASRIIFAMARDGRLPAHKMLRKVNPRTQTPIPATLLVVAVGIVVMIVMPGGALLQLLQSGTIFNNIPYAMTIVLYLVVRRKLARKDGAFNLGRFEVPVAAIALAWVLFAMFAVIASATSIVPLTIVAGILGAGALYFAYLLKRRPEALQPEPGIDGFEPINATTTQS